MGIEAKMTTLCYIEKDGAYLMLHRVSKKHDVCKDKWIGVGGGDRTDPYFLAVQRACNLCGGRLGYRVYVSVYCGQS